ncbi:type IV toxin-antitoxin system AbiEi family antitoxin domain-containing protein [Georgenia faecalis]|uniref:type IV toxin-antitoxin system AbiEi family antitoxin domain-containing protein n=1 Tax=Georgenia faecalis TaxID=2483799 RepID=UPI000FD82669|nr:type IV toxin-antitoxin system AbiEi family antitoxin domain-containing protein [Georgenia faecalis]
MTPDRARIDRLAGRQHFVVTRRQVLELGASATWLRHQVVTGRWRRLHPGVYVNHHAALDWMTRAFAALSYAGRDAALSHTAASMWWFEKPTARRLRPDEPIEVSVPFRRTVQPQPGLIIHRRRLMPAVWSGAVRATTAPETVLDLVARADRLDDVVGILTRATRTLRPEEIRAVATARSRLRHRDLVRDVLAEVAHGVESPLELRYRRGVEVAHGLPRSELQVRERLGEAWIRADCRYRAHRVRVELDGRLAHPGGRTDEDTWRDNAALLATGEITLRYRWSHVAGAPCRTAVQVAEALRAGGWGGALRRCSPHCTAR